jgi:hypothetical protein
VAARILGDGAQYRWWQRALAAGVSAELFPGIRRFGSSEPATSGEKLDLLRLKRSLGLV